MRRWQLAKLRAAGLDTYAPRTWAEASAQLQALAAAVDTQQMSAVIDALPADPAPDAVSPSTVDNAAQAMMSKVRGGKAAKPCPYCGQEFKAMHWHTPKCKMRPQAGFVERDQ